MGLITISGLAAVLGYIAMYQCESKVKHLWGYLFVMLIVVTASLQAGLSPLGHALAYGLPALAVAIWTARNFESWEGYLMATLFLMNIGGNFLGLDTYKVLTVDILDVFAWVQIGLLLALARKHPFENASEVLKREDARIHNDKRLKVVRGGFRDSRPFSS